MNTVSSRRCNTYRTVYRRDLNCKGVKNVSSTWCTWHRPATESAVKGRKRLIFHVSLEISPVSHGAVSRPESYVSPCYIGSHSRFSIPEKESLSVSLATLVSLRKHEGGYKCQDPGREKINILSAVDFTFPARFSLLHWESSQKPNGDFLSRDPGREDFFPVVLPVRPGNTPTRRGSPLLGSVWMEAVLYPVFVDYTASHDTV